MPETYKREGLNVICDECGYGTKVKHVRHSLKCSCFGVTGLSVREMEVAELITEGLTAKDIADKLGLSPKTIDVHKNNIFQKLEIHNSVQLAVLVTKERLTTNATPSD